MEYQRGRIPAHGATKSAISLLTQQMSLEWGKLGLRVNALAPGLIDGGMSEPIYSDPQFRKLRTEKVPLTPWNRRRYSTSSTLPWIR